MKSKPTKSYDPRKVKLTPYEQSIEDAVDESAPIPQATPEVLGNVREAMAESLRMLHGGKRPGAGRKAREYVKTTVLLAPSVRRKLDQLAKRHGGLSRAVEAAVNAAK